MSGISPVAPTHMDRLQNHVTGSLLLNMIDNTAKLNKKITSSSSSLNEDLNALQTKVNQMYDSVTQAADKAEAAADDAETAKAAAEEAAKVASDAKDAAEEAADKVAAIIDPVLKKPTGGADQTISGKLIATDFTTSGGVSLTGLAGIVIVKEPTTRQRISNDLIVDGVITSDALRAEKSIATNGNLTVNGTIQSDGNVTIGDSEESKTANLTVNGQITSGNVTIGKPSTATEANPDLNVDGLIKTDGLRAGELNVSGNLKVNGVITAEDDVTIGSTTGADLTVYGDIKTIAESTVDSKTTERTLTINGQGIKLTEKENGNEGEEGENILQLDVSDGNARVWSETTSLELKSNNKLSLEGTTGINLNSPTQVNADMIIGTSTDKSDLTVNGQITSGNVTIGKKLSTDAADLTVNGDIESTGTITADEIITNTITAAGTSITLDSPTQVNADMTIGTADDNPPKKLTVHGEIEASDFKSGDVTLTGLAGDAVLKSSTSDQTISGKLIASDFKSGDVTLTGLAGDAVLKSSSSAQTISSDLKLSYGGLTIGASSVDKTLLTVYGNINSTGTITADDIKTDTITTTEIVTIESGDSEKTAILQAPKIYTNEITSSALPSAKLISFHTGGVNVGAEDGTKTVTMRGNTSIGTDTLSNNLTVYGDITSTGTIITNSITSTSYPTEPTIALGGPDDEKTVTIRGETSIGIADTGGSRNLTVYGDIETTGTINIGRLSISYDPDSGVITFEDTFDSKKATITLSTN